MILKGFIEWYTHKERKKESQRILQWYAKINYEYPSKIPYKISSTISR